MKRTITISTLAAVVVAGAVLRHSAGVAFVRGAVTPANSITAPATTTAARVEMVIVLFILPLRDTGWGGVDPRLLILSSDDSRHVRLRGFETLKAQNVGGVAGC